MLSLITILSIITVIVATIAIVRSITILVDVDGTLLDASHDVWFQHMVSIHGYTRAVEMYRRIIDKDNLTLNKPLLMYLTILHACGFKLTLWTNRGETQRAMTERNLGHYMSLFSDSIYGAGHKENDMPKGWVHVIDNEDTHMVGTSNTLVATYTSPIDVPKGVKSPNKQTAGFGMAARVKPQAHVASLIVIIVTAIMLMVVLTTGAIAAPQQEGTSCPIIHQEHSSVCSSLVLACAGTSDETSMVKGHCSLTTGTVVRQCDVLSFPNGEAGGSLLSISKRAISATSQSTLTMQVTYERSSTEWSTMKTMTWRQSLQDRGRSTTKASSNTTQDPLLYVGVGGLLILFLLKGGSMFAIIAIILSLVISVAPVTETLAFEAIDAPSIELAHNSYEPIIPVGNQVQTCPILKRLRTGEWNIAGRQHGNVSADLMSGSGINSPPNIGGAVVAVLAIAAIGIGALCGEGIEGTVTMAGIGPVLRRWSGAAGELQTATVTYFIKDEGLKSLKVTAYDDDRDAAVRGLVSYVNTLPEGIEKDTILEAASRMKGRNKATGLTKETSVRGHFVCLEDVAKISKRPIKRFDIKGDTVTRRRVGQWLKKHYSDEMFAVVPIVSGEVCVVLGATFRHIAEAYNLKYSRKMVSKYLRKEILAHRMNVVEIDRTIIEIIQRRIRDGWSMLEGPSILLEEVLQGVRIPGGVGFRLFGEDLDKSRCRIKVNDTLDHLVLHTDPRNNKGTLGRKVGEGILIAYWEYEQREKPGTSGSQLFTQFAPFRKDAAGTGWAFHFVAAAVTCAYASAARLVRALQGGFMDSGFIPTEQSTEEAKGHAPALVKRDSFISRLLSLGLPVAISGTLMFLMERLIRSWSEKKRFAESAAEVWNITLPWSISGIVMAHSAREELGRVNWKIHNNHKVYWCPLYRELIIHDDLYENAHPMNDMGDEDGDMMFAWLVIQNGVERILLSRHPVGTGGFQWLDPKDVHVRWQFTKWTKTNGDIVELEKLEVGDIKEAKDWKFAPVPALEDESEPSDGYHSPDEWEAILEYEEEKRVAAVILGQAINTGTWRCGHDLDFTPVETQLIADASQNAAVNLATMIYLAGLVKSMAEQRLDGQEVADEAMVAKFGMAKRCYKSGVRVVMSTFTALINKSVHAHRTAHEGLTKMLTTRGHDVRKTEKLHDLCQERGLTANIEGGQKLLDYVGTKLATWTLQQNPNILNTLRAFENRDLKEVAEMVYGAYCIIEKNKDMDNSLFLFSNDGSGVSEDCIFGYLLKYLEIGNIDNQDPNPDGDGSDSPKEGGDMDGSGTMDEHTQFEMLNEKNMGELAQHCRDNGVKGWSKYRSLAKKANLIRLIIDSDDGDPTPPNRSKIVEDTTGESLKLPVVKIVSVRGNPGFGSKKQTDLECAVYIGREQKNGLYNFSASPLANRFSQGTPEENIENYSVWLEKEMLNPESLAYKEIVNLAYGAALHGGILLGCWCAPNPCHGDVVKKHILAVCAGNTTTQPADGDQGHSLINLLFIVVALLFLSSVAAFGMGGESVLAAAPLFSSAQRRKRQDELAHAEPQDCEYTAEKAQTTRFLMKALRDLHDAKEEHIAAELEGDTDYLCSRMRMVNYRQEEVERLEKKLDEIEKNLTPPTTWSSKSGKAHYPNECGSRQKHYWICHPECTPKCCSHGHKDEGREIFRHSPITIWWRS